MISNNQQTCQNEWFQKKCALDFSILCCILNSLKQDKYFSCKLSSQNTTHVLVKVITVFAFMLMDKNNLFELFISTFLICQWICPNISFCFIFRMFSRKHAKLVFCNMIQNLHGLVIILPKMYCAVSAVWCWKFWTGSKYKIHNMNFVFTSSR